MVFQGGALFDSMTIEENLSVPLIMFSKKIKVKFVKELTFV